MRDATLIRYNLRVLMFHNGWLLTIPLAVSQLTVFWTASTQQFSPALPAQMVEMVFPPLAAFLCAHLLVAEYRSGVGAMLASKPVDIRKVVLVRLAIALGLVWILSGLALATFYFSMEPYPWAPPLLACAVSTLFLGLLSLTFATLLRHPLAGFGIAALYWLLDLPPGPPMHPYLSLKSLSTAIPPLGYAVPEALTDSWWIAKAVLLAGAAGLYLLHNRLLFQLGTPLTARRRQWALGAAAALLAVYLGSGAAIKVGYGYGRRGTLFPSDLAWFRRQFAPYGMIPVSALFGRNFQRYLGAIPNSWRLRLDDESDLLGDNDAHRRDLRLILELAPRSAWAPSAADQLARFDVGKMDLTVEQRIAYWTPLIERYPDSPYTLFAMQQIARIYARSPAHDAQARAAYQRLLEKFPQSEYTPSAYQFLAESDRRREDWPAAEANARKWIEAAPVQEAFSAWLLLSELLEAQGKKDEAQTARGEVLKAIKAFRAAVRDKSIRIPEPRRVRIEQEARALEKRLAGAR